MSFGISALTATEIVMATAAVGGAVASSISSSEAVAEQEQALHTQELNNTYETAVRKNQTLDQLQMQLQKGEAHQAASGARFDSPSFFNDAVQSNVEADKAIKNANVASSLNQYKLKIEQQNAERQNTTRQITASFDAVSGVAGATFSYLNPENTRTKQR
jgi:hypothetical protein